MYHTQFVRLPFIKSLLVVATTSIITGCPVIGEDDDTTLYPLDYYAVISTAASDNSVGEISLISIGNGCVNDDTVEAEAQEDNYCTDNQNFSGLSDTRISVFENDFYRVGRYNQNNITKLQVDSRTPDDFLWQFSTLDAGENDSNPYKLVVKDENTAFLIRYGQSTIWVVNPSVNKTATIEEFKIGEIDLSHYTNGDADATPEAADALLINNKLFVLMQNLDSSWSPGQAYIAVFDTDDDNIEIKTNDDESTPDGIPLIVSNPSMMEYSSSNDSLYVAGVGSYSPANYEGGIEQVRLSDFSTALIVDDGDIENNPYGQTNNIAILNSTRGYFVGYHGWGNNALYSFNPTTGEVDSTPLLENNNLSDIEIGPQGNLWVTNRNESGITIFNTVDNSVAKALISTDLEPVDIEFVTRPAD